MRNFKHINPLFTSVLILFIVVVSACKNESSKEEDKNETSKSIADVEKELQKKSEIMIFNEFEDYANLKSINEVRNAFGWENCKDGISHYAEGTIEVKHTIVKNLKNNQRVKYVWNQKNPTKLDFIEASYNIYDKDFNILGHQTIESSCGMKLGMKINDLRSWNEKDFEFAGFGWDYEGTVLGSDNSKIDNCKVKITLGIENNNNAYASLDGDDIFNTSNALVKKAPIFVALFTLYNSSK